MLFDLSLTLTLFKQSIHPRCLNRTFMTTLGQYASYQIQHVCVPGEEDDGIACWKHAQFMDEHNPLRWQITSSTYHSALLLVQHRHDKADSLWQKESWTRSRRVQHPSLFQQKSSAPSTVSQQHMPAKNLPPICYFSVTIQVHALNWSKECQNVFLFQMKSNFRLKFLLKGLTITRNNPLLM